MMEMKVSDWVQGKTTDGELIHGYIETIDVLQGIVTVQVVKSDNEERVGQIVAVRSSWIKRVPDVSLQDAAIAQNLIDMALATWDESWFMELTESLKSHNQSAARREEGPNRIKTVVNRMGRSA